MDAHLLPTIGNKSHARRHVRFSFSPQDARTRHPKSLSLLPAHRLKVPHTLKNLLLDEEQCAPRRPPNRLAPSPGRWRWPKMVTSLGCCTRSAAGDRHAHPHHSLALHISQFQSRVAFRVELQRPKANPACSQPNLQPFPGPPGRCNPALRPPSRSTPYLMAFVLRFLPGAGRPKPGPPRICYSSRD